MATSVSMKVKRLQGIEGGGGGGHNTDDIIEELFNFIGFVG